MLLPTINPSSSQLQSLPQGGLTSCQKRVPSLPRRHIPPWAGQGFALSLLLQEILGKFQFLGVLCFGNLNASARDISALQTSSLLLGGLKKLTVKSSWSSSAGNQRQVAAGWSTQFPSLT